MNAQHARNMVILVAAGGALSEVLAKCQELHVRPVHLKRLTVPVEEQAARQMLYRALSQSDKYIAPTQALGGKTTDQMAEDILKRVVAGMDVDDATEMAEAFGVTHSAITRAANKLGSR